MRHNLLPFFVVFLFSCGNEKKTEKPVITAATPTRANKMEAYIKANPDNKLPSRSAGKVSNGQLINGKLFPFSGQNFLYFDTTSYLHSKAYAHGKVRKAVIETYAQLQKELPGRRFMIMECSNKNGGKIFPHRTHQNGLSIDFMSPLMKNGNPFYDLDSMGRAHYLLLFDKHGRYVKDTSVHIDFDVIAHHLLVLDKMAHKNGLRINKVILQIELKDELYATPHGKLLKQKGIYLVQKLDHLANISHDDHYHVDFKVCSSTD